MVLSSILQRITTDLRKFPYNPLNPSASYDVNLSSTVKQWIDWTRKRSALVQSMYLFRSHILQFLKSLGDMVKYATEQYKIFHKLYTLPTPVRQGEIQGRKIMIRFLHLLRVMDMINAIGQRVSMRLYS